MKKGVSGVYKIISSSTGKIYIGSSINLFSRKQKHLNDLKLNRHSNKIIQRIYNKNGMKDFVFSKIEYCSEKDLIEREQYYIEYFRSYDKKIGMNILRFAGSALGLVMSEDAKSKISKSHLTQENKKRRSETSKRLWKNKEYRKFHVKERSERYQNAEFVEKRNKTFQSKEYREKRSEIAKNIWKDPVSREKLTKERSERWTDKKRKEMSIKTKKRFQKENMSASTRNKISLSVKKSWEARKARDKFEACNHKKLLEA